MRASKIHGNSWIVPTSNSAQLLLCIVSRDTRLVSRKKKTASAFQTKVAPISVVTNVNFANYVRVKRRLKKECIDNRFRNFAIDVTHLSFVNKKYRIPMKLHMSKIFILFWKNQNWMKLTSQHYSYFFTNAHNCKNNLTCIKNCTKITVLRWNTLNVTRGTNSIPRFPKSAIVQLLFSRTLFIITAMNSHIRGDTNKRP